MRTFMLKHSSAKLRGIMKTINVTVIMVVYDEDNKMICIFCSAFSMWSLVLAEKPQKDEIFSVGCTQRDLYLKLWTDWLCVSYICGRCLMYCWRQQTRLLWLKANCHLRQLRLPGSHTVKPHVNIRGEGITVTDANTYKHMHMHTASHANLHMQSLCLFLFPLVLHEWQSYFLHCLAYCSIKPLIDLESSYLLPVEYGSL